MDEKKQEEKPKEAEKEEDKTVSLADEARGIRDEILKAKDELKTENDRKDKSEAEKVLSGTAGGHVEAKQVSPEDAKIEQSKKFFKDTALGDAITKANKKDE